MPESNKDLVRADGQLWVGSGHEWTRAPFKTAISDLCRQCRPGCVSEQPLAIISWRELAKEGGSHAAPLGRPGNCRRPLEWVPGRGTGQLAVQADNRDRSLRCW